MARGLDHIIHAVRDLDAGAELYRRLGFQVGARNRHPWGTHNRIVQFPGVFIEIVTLAEPDLLVEGGMADAFGRFHQRFLAKHEGLSGLVLESTDPARDAALFAQAAIGSGEPLHFAREGQGPDGKPVTIGFDFVVAREANSPDVLFASCRQTAPQLFWNAERQQHPNSAQTVTEIVFVADNPTDHYIFLEAFSGLRAPHSTSLGLRAETPRGIISITDATGFADRFGLTLKADETLRPAAIVFEVGDFAQAAATMAENGIAAHKHRGCLVVPPETALGAVLVLTPRNGS